jgi:hypothetical protein
MQEARDKKREARDKKQEKRGLPAVGRQRAVRFLCGLSADRQALREKESAAADLQCGGVGYKAAFKS